MIEKLVARFERAIQIRHAQKSCTITKSQARGKFCIYALVSAFYDFEQFGKQNLKWLQDHIVLNNRKIVQNSINWL